MLNNLSRIFFVVFICGLLFSSSLARAQEGALPGEIFTVLLLKALPYDRNIDRRAKERVTIGIVSLSDDAEAQGFSTQVMDNIVKVKSTVSIKDKPVEGNVLVLEKTFDKAKFEGQLKGANISVLVLAVNDATAVNNILEVTKELQVSSICGAPGCAKNGVGLEIIKKDDKPSVVINLNTVKQEGSDYDSRFLAMCEVVK